MELMLMHKDMPAALTMQIIWKLEKSDGTSDLECGLLMLAKI